MNNQGKEDFAVLIETNSNLLAREKELLDIIIALRESYAGICMIAGIEATQYKPFKDSLKYQAID